jgi:hypothetical protein
MRALLMLTLLVLTLSFPIWTSDVQARGVQDPMKMATDARLSAIGYRLSAMVTSAAPTKAEICFPNVPGITNCIATQFASYWQSNGGLPVFGYPIGPRELGRPEPTVAPLYLQWTERNRLESHPDAPLAYQVQLGRMGAERLAQIGRDPTAEPAESGPQDGCLWFVETRHNVCDQGKGLGFRRYWESHGLRINSLNAYQRSLALFGLPLTAAKVELSANGEPFITQWFERARFEWHPSNPNDYKVLLGLLGNELRTAPAPTSSTPAVFGVEVNRDTVSHVTGQLGELGTRPVRYNGILWSEVEPTQGQRTWTSLASVDSELAAISAAGGAPMVIVRSTPAWARQVTSSACGAIKADSLPAFAAFMGDLVTRYSQPPYNVHTWELGNEPDIDVNLVGSDAVFGCWGDAQRADYGGAAYAAMLKAAYPAIKAADPQANVVLGGLLLNCDPSYAPTQPCPSGPFFEGILQAGGGDFFDTVAYHAYAYWQPKQIDWDTLHPNWTHRGGLLIGKLQFLRDVMTRYGIAKPVLMDEGGLLCYHSDPSCGPGGFYNDQANYLVRLYARSSASHLVGALWYTLNGPGWQEGGLLDAAQQPRPAYRTLVFLTRTLSGAAYVTGGIEGNVEHHNFRRGDRSYTIYWTNDASSATIAPPAGSQTVYTLFGDSSPIGQNLTIGFTPIIVEGAVGQ